MYCTQERNGKIYNKSYFWPGITATENSVFRLPTFSRCLLSAGPSVYLMVSELFSAVESLLLITMRRLLKILQHNFLSDACVSLEIAPILKYVCPISFSYAEI